MLHVEIKIQHSLTPHQERMWKVDIYHTTKHTITQRYNHKISTSTSSQLRPTCFRISGLAMTAYNCAALPLMPAGTYYNNNNITINILYDSAACASLITFMPPYNGIGSSALTGITIRVQLITFMYSSSPERVESLMHICG